MGKTFLGQNVSDLEIGEQTLAISRIILNVDGETTYTAGDDSGKTLEKSCPWGSQAMADRILASVSGVRYRPFTGTDGLLDLSAEVGDGITVGGVYSELVQTDITFDRLCAAEVSAPGANEATDEYPYQSRAQRQAARELAKIRSSITKTAERITLLVENEIEGLEGKLELTASSLSAQIKNAEGEIGQLELTATLLQSQISNAVGDLSYLRQTVNSITLGVQNGSESSTITMYKNGIAVSSQNISFTGMVTFNDLSGNRGTVINGGAIDTNTLRLNSLYGNFIYINDAYGQQAAVITATGASSFYGQKFLLSSGAVEIDAGFGDIYLSSSNGTLQIGSGQTAVGGDCVPAGSGIYALGRGGLKWTDVYANNGTIVTSDREKKTDVSYDLSGYGALFDALRPASYRLRDGESGRTHLGLIAQDVEEALAACGLSDMDFAGLIRSPQVDGEGREMEGAYDYALRYGEFLPLCIGKIQELTARVAKLERRLSS